MKKYEIVILCGGKGTRVRRYTNKIPKCLIKFNGKPFIYHQLKLLKYQGINNAVISVKFMKNKIIKYFKEHIDFMNYKIVEDGDKYLGTGGAIKKILKYMNKNFFILYGDSYPNFNINNLKKYNKCNMAIFNNKNKFDKSNISLNKLGTIKYYEKIKQKKLNYIDYGITYTNKDIFKVLKLKKFNLPKMFDKISSMGKLHGYIVKKRFYEIGSYKGIKDFKKFINKNEIYQ